MKLNPYLILAGLSVIVLVFPFWKGQVRTNRCYDDTYSFFCEDSCDDGDSRRYARIKANSICNGAKFL